MYVTQIAYVCLVIIIINARVPRHAPMANVDNAQEAEFVQAMEVFVQMEFARDAALAPPVQPLLLRFLFVAIKNVSLNVLQRVARRVLFVMQAGLVFLVAGLINVLQVRPVVLLTEAMFVRQLA